MWLLARKLARKLGVSWWVGTLAWRKWNRGKVIAPPSKSTWLLTPWPRYTFPSYSKSPTRFTARHLWIVSTKFMTPSWRCWSSASREGRRTKSLRWRTPSLERPEEMKRNAEEKKTNFQTSHLSHDSLALNILGSEYWIFLRSLKV